MGWLECDFEVELGARTLRCAMVASAPCVALTGASGSGKSSIVRAMVAPHAPLSGFLRVNGQLWHDAHMMLPAHERGAGWVPQHSLLMPHLDARQNLLFGPRAQAEHLEQVARALELEGLLERRVRHLSGGERQRVALGRALLSGAQALFLDEPFAALDGVLRERVAAFVGQWCAQHAVPCLLVSHGAREVSALAGQVFCVRGEGVEEEEEGGHQKASNEAKYPV